MSAYLITREGQELGAFEMPQIQDGLKTGFLQTTDWGWREGMADWKSLAEIAALAAAAPVKPMTSPSSVPVKIPTAAKPADINPYAAPTANVVRTSATGTVPHEVIVELRGTKPWVRLISIVMFIGCAFFVFALVTALFNSMAWRSGAYGVGMTVGYGVIMLLVIYPTWKLSKYASHIARLVETESFADLASALAEQRRFWKFYGILIVIYLGVLGLVLAGSFFLGSRW